MIAVDTNVLVRLLAEDHAQEAAAARSRVGSGPVWIPKTVLLEAAWVLRSVYSVEDAAIWDAFTKLLGLKNVHTEDELSVTNALALSAHGIEFTDALHLASRPRGAAFFSFDRSFVRRALACGSA